MLDPVSYTHLAEQLKKAEPSKKKLGDTMKLGEALQNLFHTETEEAQEQEEIELSEEDAEEYEEDIEELAEEDAGPVEGCLLYTSCEDMDTVCCPSFWKHFQN